MKLNWGSSMYFKKCRGTVCVETPSEKDIEYIMHLWADKQTMADVGRIVEMTAEQMHDWYERVVNPGDGTHCYTLIHYEGVPAGEVSFHRYDSAEGKAEFNIKVEHRYRGRGIALIAGKMLLEIFFNDYSGKIMEDRIAAGNSGAESLLEKLGFVHAHEQDDEDSKMYLRFSSK